MTTNQTSPALTIATETTPAPKRGILLPCPCCNEQSATIQLTLADGESLYCADCENTFTLDDVRNFMEKWAKVLAWVDAMPTDGI